HPDSDAPAPDRNVTPGALPAPGPSRREVLEGILTDALGSRVRRADDFRQLYATLDALDAPFRPVDYDLKRITRTVLQLPPDAHVSRDDIRAALSIAASANRRGFADSVSTIALYRLQRMDVLAAATLRAPTGSALGRDLTNGTMPAGVSLRHVGMDLTTGRSRSSVPAAVEAAPPWPGNSFVYAAERAGTGRVRIHSPRGPVEINDGMFARLISMDPDRPAGADVVLALPGESTYLARRVADAANVRVWSNDGAFRWGPTENSAGRSVPVQYRSADNTPYGEWSASYPGMLPDDPNADWRDNRGHRHSDRSVRSWAVTDGGAGRVGSVFLPPDQMAMVEGDVRQMSAVAHFSHRRDTDPMGLRLGEEYGLTRMAQPLAGTYAAFLHGRTDLAQLPGRSASHNLRGPALGGFLARRKSIETLPADHGIWLVSCESATMHPTRDPLHDVPVPQHVANSTGRTVWAADRSMELRGAEDGLPPRLVLMEQAGQPDGTVHAFHPEPDAETRDSITTHTGLSPRASDPATRVLTWVRALRTLGDRDIDVDPARNQAYSARLYGFAALENERLALNPQAGPLTWAELQRLVADESARQGYTGVPFDLTSLEFALHHARERALGRAAEPGGYYAARPGDSDTDTDTDMRDADSSSELSELSRTPSLPDAPDFATESAGAAGTRDTVADPHRAESTAYIAEIARRTPAQRDALMGDPAWVAEQRRTLPPAQFAELAAVLMVRTAPGVEQPVSARQMMRRRVADMLVNPDVTEVLLQQRTQMTVLPRTTSLVDVAPMHRTLRDDPSLTPVRGLAKDLAGLTFVGEETLLGGVGPFERFGEGVSVVTHETAHAIHVALTDYTGDDTLLRDSGEIIRQTFDRARAAETLRREAIEREIAAVAGQPNEAAEIQRILRDPNHRGFPWPNGEFARRNPDGSWTRPNYSATNAHEFFAELTNAYLDVNRDDITGPGVRNSGAAWVRQNTDLDVSSVPPENASDAPLHHIPRELFQLLVHLYGERGTVPGTVRNETTLPTPNPRRETARDETVLDAAREFTAYQDATLERENQLLDVFGPGLRDDAPRLRELVERVRLAEELRAGDPAFREGPTELRQLTRDLLQRPHGDLTPAHVLQALDAARDARARGIGTLTDAAVLRLLTAGALGGHSRLDTPGGALQGRTLSGDDPGVDLSTVAVRTGTGAVTQHTPPWAANTYAVGFVRTDSGHYRVRLGDGTTAEVTAPVLAQLIRRDNGSAGHSQIALLTTDPGHHLAALLANATGHRVWSTNQELSLGTSPHDADRSSVLADPRGMQGREHWIPTDPGNHTGDPATAITFGDGAVHASGDIASRVVVDGTSRQITSTFFVHLDQNAVGPVGAMANAVDAHLRTTHGEQNPTPPQFTLIGRGTDTAPQLHLNSNPTQPRTLSGQEAVRFLTRGQNLRSLPEQSQITLLWPGFTTPTTTDPLTDT
ncbi:lonely Cys domain-containing protein, partial [Streptomyces otsuchiensis]|uniref:lonely Cys domain-containing protein n=1 Tax=Streptomyces otsuchiensis TaxID=2681388 RepID=UPI001031AA86